MPKELEKSYNPAAIEDDIYKMWNDGGYFTPSPENKKPPYTIVIPPPNVTGQLHMGHALDETLQDILIRYKRMSGYNALWVPGTDHAGIATQIKVEENLRVNENLTRYDLGREKFLERVWDWKNKYGSRIINQLKKLGCSCDWTRERFTMDEGCSKAVREVFVSLYEKGLIYRGHRIANWCPHCKTALSDAEVDNPETPGSYWHIKYFVKDSDEYVIVATTRPDSWDCARVGAGAAPIRTEEGWLEIYHGADYQNRYCLGALLLDLNDPSKVIARSKAPIMEPIAPYEQTGFFGNVVFTNGHLVEGDTVTIYYGASDEVICGAKLSIEEILRSLKS